MPATMTPPRTKAKTSLRTLADVLRSLGDVPASRVRMNPIPGTATEADAVLASECERPCELVNGTLVEKAMGVPQTFYASMLLTYLNLHVLPRGLGAVLMADAHFRMIHGNLRMPDVSFTQGDRLPDPLPQIGGWCPDLCVEVISPKNTKAEIALKRSEFFASGCKLFWEVNTKSKTVTVYSSISDSSRLSVDDVLTGGSVLPGFELSLRELFGSIDKLRKRKKAE